MIQIRELADDDFSFLQEMAVQAMWWQSTTELPSLAQALLEPEFAKLLDRWGRRGDCAVIATQDDERVGAAWFRLWDDEQHSYGYVDSTTPELGIAVIPSMRGRGVGRTLLEAVVDRARGQSYDSLSLSVNPANFARRLYESVGFVKVSVDDGGSWTMVALLNRTGT
jgi:ribosomal protein S18 acetylase RimI-like enzyme